MQVPFNVFVKVRNGNVCMKCFKILNIERGGGVEAERKGSKNRIGLVFAG